MKRTVVCCLLCLGVLFFAGCARDDHPTTPAAVEPSSPECGVDPAAIAGQIVAATGWETDSDAIVPVERPQSGRPVHPGELFDWGREILWSDVAHYWWDIPVGSGTYDRIRLHRVVRERRPNKPIHTSEAVFLQHGAFVGFVKFIFGSASPGTPDDHSAAVYLARNDIDVWGIDQNWALVPAGTTDFSFMEDWGIQGVSPPGVTKRSRRTCSFVKPGTIGESPPGSVLASVPAIAITTPKSIWKSPASSIA